jgi:signal transduction histidine kinase
MTYSSTKIHERELQLIYFKSAFNHIEVGVSIKDCNGIYTYVNNSVCDLFQSPALDIIGYTDEDFFDLTKSNELKYYDILVIENGRKIGITETNFFKDSLKSKASWSVKTPLYNINGESIALYGISKDTSNKTLVENILKQTKQIQKNILNDAQVNIFVKESNLNHNYVKSNFAQEAIAPNIVIKKDRKNFRNMDVDGFEKTDMEFLSTVRKVQKRTSRIGNSNTYKDYQAVKVPLLNDNKCEGPVHIMNNITEMQKKLLKENNELKFSLKQRNFFLDMVAHDLKAPIAFIKLMSEILKKSARKKDINMLGLIHDSSIDMIELVNNLLDISVIESGFLNLRKTNIDYVLFIKEVVRKNQFIAREKNIKIKTNIKFTSKFIKIDGLRIEQVFNNLISNAIKFSDFNSIITINFFEKNNNIFTQIIDEGQGIRPEDIDEIFMCFGKSSAIPTNREKSHGLGLSIAKKIINAHNGQINVKSILKKGSIFTFNLPL